MRDSGAWVYDLEIFKNFFLGCFKNISTGRQEHFILHNDGALLGLTPLVEFVNEDVRGLIGFNNLAYDDVILHYILNNNGQVTNQTLYDLSQDTIASEWPNAHINDLGIHSLDLCKLHHLDRFGVSLKAAAAWMRCPVIQDLPERWDSEIEEGQISTIVDYCQNDVHITEELYKRSKKDVDLRKKIGKAYGIDVISASDSKIGNEMMLSLLSKAGGESKKEIKSRRTHRNVVHLKQCIPRWVKYSSKEYNDLLGRIREMSVTETKGALSHSVTYKGFRADLGLGGIHGCAGAGVYRTSTDLFITEVDVVSMYPRLTVSLGIRPEHLGETFSSVYSTMFYERQKWEKGTAENYALKIAMNACFGRMGSEHSYMFDIKALLSITLGGQLTMLMLLEMALDIGCKVLYTNTDSICILANEDKTNEFKGAIKEFESSTDMEFDEESFDSIVLRDVNSLIKIAGGTVITKGAFGTSPGITKNPSELIVSKAVYNYFVEGVPIEQTIRSSRDVYDFCILTKATRGWTHYWGDQAMQKTMRFIVTKRGQPMTKRHEDGRVISIKSGRLVTDFNRYKEGPYHLDYSYYIGEAQKIIDAVLPPQLKLF